MLFMLWLYTGAIIGLIYISSEMVLKRLKLNCMVVMVYLHGPELYTNDVCDVYDEQVVL